MKGLRLDHGYLQIRVTHKGTTYHCENFGKDSPEARQIAEIKLTEIRAKLRKEILLGKIGMSPKLPEKRFRELVPVFLKHWEAETDGDGYPLHPEKSIVETTRIFEKSLIPFFGDKLFHLITPSHVADWRAGRLKPRKIVKDGIDTVKRILGTSVNREMVPLSSMFTKLAQLIALEKVEAFVLPVNPQTGAVWNPCAAVNKAAVRKRERIPTDYELRKIKNACITVVMKDQVGIHEEHIGDPDAWEICKLALKSILSEKDLRKLEVGSTIDLNRSKTGVPVHIPVTVLQKLNWKNWQKRWRAIRKLAGCPDIQFRDLRKKGGNHLVGHFDTKLVSQYFGHASVKTTEGAYTVIQQDKMRPLAESLDSWVESL